MFPDELPQMSSHLSRELVCLRSGGIQRDHHQILLVRFDHIERVQALKLLDLGVKGFQLADDVLEVNGTLTSQFCDRSIHVGVPPAYFWDGRALPCSSPQSFYCKLDTSDEFGFVRPLEFLFEIVSFFCHTRVFPLF
jgi:hypothetical protein